VPALSSFYRTAFVTGASGGLGQAFVEALLGEGIRVWGTARDRSRLSGLTGRDGFVPLELDLAQAAAVEETFRSASTEAGGGFDVVINNAGYGVFSPFTDAAFASWQAQWDVLFSAAARLSQEALKSMLPRKRGCVINISSLAVDFPLPYMSGYNAAKAALSAFSESLIFEMRGTGVTVIDFRPGDYRTPFNQAMQSNSRFASSDVRLAAAWAGLERNLAASPLPRRAAQDLIGALRRGRSGTVYSGSLFQARIAPLLARFAPAGLRRQVAARYFGAT
jgi:short-subunit dehydrogenase